MQLHIYPSAVPEEVTTYTTLIADVQDVHDESSDFELPDTVVAWGFRRSKPLCCIISLIIADCYQI